MLAADESISDIARAMGRDKSTISREQQRHANRDGTYRPLTAQKRAEQTARTAHARTRKLSRPGPLRDYVEQGLQQRWSPQEIAYRLPQDQPDDPLMRVSAEFGRGRLVGTISISERPAEAEDRAVPGHWEGDLIVRAKNGSAIGTLVERTTRFVMLIHLPGRRTAEEFHQALTPTITALPQELRRSLTWDNGKEMGMHAQIAIDANIAIYFADPHSPWQRGSNENTNGPTAPVLPQGHQHASLHTTPVLR